MSRPSIAAVIPTFNRAGVLGRAVESVLAQRRRPDEVIVVDDGSLDNTHEVVEAYAGDLVFVRKANGGVSSARNAGVHRSTTDFVAFLDSDDFWYEDHLDRIENAIEATDGRAGLYFSDQRLAPSRGNAAWQRADFSIDGSHSLTEDGRSWVFLAKQPMTVNASVVRRDAFLRADGFDERLTCREDTHLFLKLGLCTPLCAVAGQAGMLTADDSRSLSRRYASNDLAYLNCTILLYTDLVQRFEEALVDEERKLLSRRLAMAHWSLARQLGFRSLRRSLLHLGTAVAYDPNVLPRKLRRRVGSAKMLGSSL
jgi:glycosyltransferase involved in cell wall biosynthesis